MNFSLLPFVVIIASLTAFMAGQQKARKIDLVNKSMGNGLHSLPSYHGLFMAFCVAFPAFIIILSWFSIQDMILVSLVQSKLPPGSEALNEVDFSLIINDVKNFIDGGLTSGNNPELVHQCAIFYRTGQEQSQLIVASLVIVSIVIAFLTSYRAINIELRTRNIVERIITCLLFLASAVAVLTTVGIVLSVLFESIRFFQHVPITDFLFGTKWSPQTAMRADQAGSSGAFGIIPIFTGTILIASIAMMVAIPLGLLAAIYLSEYSSSRVRTWAKPMLEILAGIPTVVYGFFAALTVAPLIRNCGEFFGVTVASESALAAGLVMGIMIIPFISSLSDDVIHAVPQSMRDGSYGLGATKSETILQVLLPAALPGVVGSILLAVSRAVGETMIVVMAAGLSANFSFNPLSAVTTITVQIVTLLTGDQEFDSAKTLAAFALGLFLFVFTLLLNIVALHIVRRYREQYD
ncbi:MAG: phosphate ABC transporter permease subunit PstC [Desulfotalea sp.]